MSIQRARRLRGTATDSERRLWRVLRLFRQQGLHFRRQVPIGRYVADFACHRAKIVVELDGSQHGDKRKALHDLERTAFMESQGYRVLRFGNFAVTSNVVGVAELIFAEVHARVLPPPEPPSAVRPPHVGGGGVER